VPARQPISKLQKRSSRCEGDILRSWGGGVLGARLAPDCGFVDLIDRRTQKVTWDIGVCTHSVGKLVTLNRYTGYVLGAGMAQPV
jgi:hypothetical protein